MDRLNAVVFNCCNSSVEPIGTRSASRRDDHDSGYVVTCSAQKGQRTKAFEKGGPGGPQQLKSPWLIKGENVNKSGNGKTKLDVLLIHYVIRDMQQL